MSQPNPALCPPDPQQAAARLIEWFGIERARQVALGYALGRWEAGDPTGEAGWRQVIAVLDAVALMSSKDAQH